MKEKKKTLRAQVKAAGRPDIDGRSIAERIAGRIEELPQFCKARTVALYHALPDEVPTAGILQRWQGGKRLALPVIESDRMIFHEYTGDDNLRTGAFGIGEPHEGRIVPPGEIDLMLVPGVAFDAAGYRLGRGKGFYDSYLSAPEAAHIYKVGVCPPHALVSEVPVEPHDVRMDTVVNG